MVLGRQKRKTSCDDLLFDTPGNVQAQVDDTVGEDEKTLLPPGYILPPRPADQHMKRQECSSELLIQRTGLTEVERELASSSVCYSDLLWDSVASPRQTEVPTPRFVLVSNSSPHNKPTMVGLHDNSGHPPNPITCNGEPDSQIHSQSLTSVFDNFTDEEPLDSFISTMSDVDRTRWPTEKRLLAGYYHPSEEVPEQVETPFPKLNILKRREPERNELQARDAALRRAEIAHEESLAWAAELRKTIDKEAYEIEAASPELSNAGRYGWKMSFQALQSQTQEVLQEDDEQFHSRNRFAQQPTDARVLVQDEMDSPTVETVWRDNASSDFGHGLGQMPEGLRRRLEQRATDLRAAKADRQVTSNDKGVDEQLSSPQRVRRSPPCSSVSQEEEPINSPSCVLRDPVPCKSPPQERLPPLDPNYPLRGLHRCKSQPPGEPSVGSPVHGKPLTRHQSLGPKADDESGGRQMFDKNTLRVLHRDFFVHAIQQIRKEVQSTVPQDIGNLSEISKAVRVYARKRPIFPREENTRSDYDVLTVCPSAPCSRAIILHNCLFQADLKTPFINHHTFNFDYVFGEHVDNTEVYMRSAMPLVKSVCCGGMGTMFMFGQTGSGKTHTMTAIEEFAVRDLFASSQGLRNPVTIQFIELRGDRCFDLLTPAENPACGRRGKVALTEIKLREQKNGLYVADGATVLAPEFPEELCTIMRLAHARRATSATDANDVSSRSHAVCTLRLVHSRGQLLLIDCAGTERRKDSMYHSKERQAEGAEINASLHALKECIRYLITKKHIPSHAFRASSLTKVLAEAFSQGVESQLSVVCTASPCSSDTEHTLTTLRTGVSLCPSGKEHEDRQHLTQFIHEQAQPNPRVQHPKVWTPDQVRSWITEVAEGKFRHVADALPSNFTGQMLIRLTAIRCVQLCGGNQRRGHELFDLLHEEMRKAR